LLKTLKNLEILLKYKHMRSKEWRGKILEQRIKNRKNYMQGPKSSQQQWQTYGRLFKVALNGRKNSVILILGSTPELRDLALSYKNSKLITADLNPDMISGMSELMKFKNSKREAILIREWSKMKVKENSLDLIAGDAAMVNLNLKQLHAFFSLASRALKPGGKIVLREAVRVSKLILPPESIIKKSREEKWHWFDLHAFLCFGSSGKWYNKKTFKNFMAVFYKWAEKEFFEKKFTKEEYKKLRAWKGNLVHSILPEKKFQGIFHEFFIPLKVNQPNDLRYQKFIKFFFGEKYGKAHTEIHKKQLR